jgi:hypothetical protein
VVKRINKWYKLLIIDSPPLSVIQQLSLNNSKAKNALLNGIGDSVYENVMHCISAKEIWDKLQNIYEGDEKFKETKLQTYRG